MIVFVLTITIIESHASNGGNYWREVRWNWLRSSNCCSSRSHMAVRTNSSDVKDGNVIKFNNWMIVSCDPKMDSKCCATLIGKPLSWMRQWNDIEAVVKELPNLDLKSWTKELYSVVGSTCTVQTVFASCLILWMPKAMQHLSKAFCGLNFDRIW